MPRESTFMNPFQCGSGAEGWPRGIWPVLCPRSPPAGPPCESLSHAYLGLRGVSVGVCLSLLASPLPICHVPACLDVWSRVCPCVSVLFACICVLVVLCVGVFSCVTVPVCVCLSTRCLCIWVGVCLCLFRSFSCLPVLACLSAHAQETGTQERERSQEHGCEVPRHH